MLAGGCIHALCTIHLCVCACVHDDAQVLAYALVSSSMLAAMLGSSMSTFGVEKCRGSATLGPLFPDVARAAQIPAVQEANEDAPAGTGTGTGAQVGTGTWTGTGTGTADEESEDMVSTAASVVSGGLLMVGTIICLPVQLRRTSRCA